MSSMLEMEYARKSSLTILYSGFYKNYEFIIVSHGTHPCAYVKMPKTHPLYAKMLKSNIYDYFVQCHGGVTFISTDGLFNKDSEDRREGLWFGWDYHHFGMDFSGGVPECGGKKWTTAEIYDEVKAVIVQLINKNNSNAK